MSKRRPDLPDFAIPPVTEVALSVQFRIIENLRTPQMGLLWLEFRDRFESVEEHPPLEPATEAFGRPQGRLTPEFRIDVNVLPPVPRLWFLNSESTELVQIQQDRFVHNWRKTGELQEYPRYESIRETFVDELKTFVAFLEKEKLGEMISNQCEVTYVNHIYAEEGGDQHPKFEEVFTVWKREYSDGFLNEAEDARFQIRYSLPGVEGSPIGRLHVSAEPRFRVEDGKPLLVLTLTARGIPQGVGIDGIVSFLNLGRYWIVKGFASITTQKMHKSWGRKDGT